MLLEIGRISLEIFLLAWLIYGIFSFIQGTRADFILTGFFIFAGITTVASQLLNLTVISYLIDQIWAFVPIFLVVVFQSEIRRALTILGRHHFKKNKSSSDEYIKSIINACFYLSQKKTGALIAIEKDLSLNAIEESGTEIDALVSAELLTQIFYKNSPLHDGGVIIRNERIAFAGCVFPLTDKINLPQSLGLRHRASLGVSEESDCLCIIVSEETGNVSFTINGEITQNVNETQLFFNLKKQLIQDTLNKTSIFKIIKKRVFLNKKKETN